jgi:hypothetical protein
MNIDFRIPVFESTNNGLNKIGDTIFQLRFIQGKTYKTFRICVDGKLTPVEVNCFNYESKKSKFLEAINIAVNTQNLDSPKKFLTEQKLKDIFSKKVANAFLSNILNSCETVQKRDELEKYNLIIISKNKNL